MHGPSGLNKRCQMLQCYESSNEHLTQDFSVINSGMNYEFLNLRTAQAGK